MKHKFRIGNIYTEPFSEIQKLSEITDESLKKYKAPGVWVLFGRNEDKIWLCLQVGQSNDIGSEIKSDVQCISGNIKEQTNRTYINQFGNVVNGYRYNIYLTPREQIYKQIGEKYLEFVFICICCGNDCKDKKKSIEKYVAWKFRALFWRNGGAFKNQNDNVKEPQDIDKIAFDEKESVDKMVKMYDAQKRIYT